MIRAASREHLPRIRELLKRSNRAPYDIAVVAEEKCFGDGYSGPPKTRVFVSDGDVAGVSVVCGKFLRILAVDPRRQRQGIGSALLEDGGASVIAAEAGNYFTPGVVDTDRATIDFFLKRGYRETMSTHNLEAKSAAGVGGAPLRADETTRPRVLAFIEKEFGKIWRFEASRAVALFYAEENGDVVGFSAHEANNRGLGTFGPTGVARSMRGRGLGRQLLHASLADLGRLGYERVIIPWTDAIDFYRKSCGAVAAHRFLTLSKQVVSAS